MSKRIVFAVWGSLGDLYPYLAVARALQDRGHSCVVATTDFHRERVEAAQLEFAPLGPHLDADTALMKNSMNLRRGPRFLLGDIVIPYTRQGFAEAMALIEGADVLVTYPIVFGAHLAAQKSGIRWASTTLAPMGFFSVHDRSPRRQSPALEKLNVGPWLDRWLMRYACAETNRWAAPIHAYRRELGLSTDTNPIIEGQFSPQLTLAMFSPLFGQPQPDWPPNTVVTGFPFYDHPTVMDERLRNFLANGEPPVVFTLGSAASMAPRKFFEESLKAIAQLQCRAVLIVGLYGPNQFSNGLPPNVAAFPYAPYEKLFPRAAVNVHHGGIGTTSQALRSGRPMLVVPFAFDQPDNAARANAMGVARTVFINDYKARRIARELDALLHDPACAERANAVGEHVRVEDGAGRACDELLKLARRQSISS
jgi:rhamnosyltransferase subunit B